MKPATALRLSATALVASGGLALAVAGSETATSGTVMVLVSILAALLGSPRPRNAKIRKHVWNILALLALFLFLGELALTRDLLSSVVRLVSAVTASICMLPLASAAALSMLSLPCTVQKSTS